MTPTSIDGCFVVDAPMHRDDRGTFSKPFQSSTFPVADQWREIYWSRSNHGVVRGMHYQLPPADHGKLVWCVAGAAFDAVVDLRAEGRGRTVTETLTAENGRAIYVPRGCAHGFAALADNTVMIYAVTSEHDPALDSGVRWDSIDVEWPVDLPLVSQRDAELPPLSL